MKRIEEYKKEIAASASDYLRRGNGPGVMQLYGRNGIGKTMLARQYLKDHGGLYFSFRSMDAAFAPRIFIPGCNSWQDFFVEIRNVKNRPVIFFDDMDDRNDKEIFLEMLPQLAGIAYVILIYRRKVTLPFETKDLQMMPLTPASLRRSNKNLKALDALRIIALTDGIPELVSQFDLNKDFEENIRSIFSEGSLYLRYASEELSREFRSPESYNTLLYGMAIGHNRISQLAEFSGYPKNKVDKYLKALDCAGFIETKQRKDDAGQIRTHYYPKGGYLRTWYRLYFPQQENFCEPLNDDTLSELLLQIDEHITKYYFRKCCWQWLRYCGREYFWDSPIALNNAAQYDVTINGIDFDFVQHDKDRDLYVKILDTADERFSKELFHRIETATTKTKPFYNNVYFLFSIRRAGSYVEDLRNLGSVAVVDADTFFTNESIKLLERI
jgi:AAA+ ATPase superfamily predicted ATPase